MSDGFRGRETVIEFSRSSMVFKRDASEIANLFPAVDEPWRVEADDGTPSG